MDCLTVLNLEGDVQDSILLQASKLNLRALVIKNNVRTRAITDEGVVHLSNATALTVLSLRDSGIGDQGFVCISTLTNLEYLDLSASQLTDTGIRKATEPRKSATGCDIPAWHCFAGLRWLRLEQSAATLHGLHFLARLPAFEALIWSSASHTIQSPRASVDKSACARRHFRKRQAMSQTQTASHALAEAAADMEFPHAGKLVRDLLCRLIIPP